MLMPCTAEVDSWICYEYVVLMSCKFFYILYSESGSAYRSTKEIGQNSYCSFQGHVISIVYQGLYTIFIIIKDLSHLSLHKCACIRNFGQWPNKQSKATHGSSKNDEFTITSR